MLQNHRESDDKESSLLAASLAKFSNRPQPTDFAFAYEVLTLAGLAHWALKQVISGPGQMVSMVVSRGFFIFIFFISVFYKNIFSIWKFTEIYPGRTAAGRPGPGRPTAGRQGLICKKKTKTNCRQVPGNRPPGSWAAGIFFFAI